MRQPDGAAKPPGRTTLAAWRVTALIFEPAAAQTLLGCLDEPGLLGEGQVLPGGSLQYFAAVGQLAGDLAARGRVLPVLDTGASDGYWARWRPVLAGPDAQRARELAAAMPPLCRSFSTEGEPAAQVFGEALDELTDAAVRARLAADPAFTLLPPGQPGEPPTPTLAQVVASPQWSSAGRRRSPAPTPRLRLTLARRRLSLPNLRSACGPGTTRRRSQRGRSAPASG